MNACYCWLLWLWWEILAALNPREGYLALGKRNQFFYFFSTPFGDGRAQIKRENKFLGKREYIKLKIPFLCCIVILVHKVLYIYISFYDSPIRHTTISSLCSTKASTIAIIIPHLTSSFRRGWMDIWHG